VFDARKKKVTSLVEILDQASDSLSINYSKRNNFEG